MSEEALSGRQKDRTKLAELSKTNVTSYILLTALMTRLSLYHQLSRVCLTY